MPAWAKALVARQDAFEQRLDQNIARLDDQLATLTRETKAAESAIAQALKLLQAQVMSKAARAELQHGLSRAVEAATDAQERSRAVASNLVAIASEVDSRAPLKALARLETSMQSQLAASASGASSGPILHAKRITAQPESALMPTHCLSCQQPLPTYSHYSPPHETAYLPAGLSLSPGRAASSGRRTPTRGLGCGSPDSPPDAGVDLGAAAGAVTLTGKSFHTMGSLRRDGVDLMRNPKLTYGVPPANETRKQTQLQLHMLAANRTAGSASGLDGGGGGGGGGGAGGGRARPSTAKGERFGRVEAVVGRQPSRPTSAAALLPGQSRSVRGGVRASASAGSLGVVSQRVLDVR